MPYSFYFSMIDLTVLSTDIQWLGNFLVFIPGLALFNNLAEFLGVYFCLYGVVSGQYTDSPMTGHLR